jgi:pyroglutamyl-peptidase
MGYTMTLPSATPENYPSTLAYRRACLRGLLGREPPASACRAVLAGDRAMAAQVLGEEAGVLDALPGSWWMGASAAQPARVIFTGFEPFGGHAYNPSWTAARAAARVCTGAHLTAQARQLPVTFEVARAAPAAIFAEIPATHAALVLHLGLAAGRDAVCLERYAHNTRGHTADNAGAVGTLAAPYDVLEDEGPAARETLMPLELLIELMGELGQAAALTRDPGDYVCNATYYAALAEVERRRAAGLAADALFVHVPSLSAAQADAVGQVLGRAVAAWLHAA